MVLEEEYLCPNANPQQLMIATLDKSLNLPKKQFPHL